MTAIYKSDYILSLDDLYDIQEQASNLVPVRYLLTDDEMGWLSFVNGKYSIADFVTENSSIDDETENYILSIESFDLSVALDDDCEGMGKAVMLSDDTALQKLFFWCYTDTNDHYDDDVNKVQS